jgi:hypothetical protein
LLEDSKTLNPKPRATSTFCARKTTSVMLSLLHHTLRYAPGLLFRLATLVLCGTKQHSSMSVSGLACHQHAQGMLLLAHVDTICTEGSQMWVFGIPDQ